MADPVDPKDLLTDARRFLAELAENNDRAWFQQNKGRYDSTLKRPAERLLADIGGWLEKQQDAPVRAKLFRPHRDVRFSEDKTPYHTHLHMMWSLQDGRGWMLGIARDYASAGAGIMGFDADGLERWREAVAGADGEALDALLQEAGWRLPEPELKRVPPPYPADHPQGALLRRKGLLAWQDNLDAALEHDPRAALQDSFAAFSPLMAWLGRAL